MKFRTALLALSLSVAAASAANAEAIYSIFPENCQVGWGGEGVIVLKDDGGLTITETSYEPKGKKKVLNDGWYQQKYDLMAEGEPYGSETMLVRPTNARIWVKAADGQVLNAGRCR